jgi:hypothetical protein
MCGIGFAQKSLVEQGIGDRNLWELVLLRPTSLYRKEVSSVLERRWDEIILWRRMYRGSAPQ